MVISRLLLSISRWLLLAGVIAAPWAYAGVPQGVQMWFGGWLLGAFLLWTLALGGRRGSDAPHLPRLQIWSAVLLLAQGWMLIANAQSRFDWATFSFLPVTSWWSGAWAPGALDTAEALPAMVRVTGLLAALIMMTDMGRTPPWRSRLFGALLGGGFLVALCGLLQRALHSPLGLWRESERDHTYFAAFYYHGNAGAFLNLLVPGFALLAVRRPVIGTWGALLLMLAASIATVSKAAMVLTLLLLVLALLPSLGRKRRLLWLIPAPVILMLLLPRVRARWAELPALLQWHNPRLLAWRAEFRMLPDAGLWGIGPANFKFAFPHYTGGLDPAIAGFWEYAHQDFLQTAIEWGWCGFALWALLIGGALRSGSGLVHRSALLAVLGALLHGLGDYPLQIPALQLFFAGWLGILWSDLGLPCPSGSVESETHFQDGDENQPVTPGLA